jgi:alanyl-tRNA synthetase
LAIGDFIDLIVDSPIRLATMKNHTATHLLAEALTRLLNTDIKQTGSLVTDQYLRFDFAYNGDIDQELINSVENLVNEKILENIKLEVKYMTLSEAISNGAKAFFEEKYNPENVRVVEVPGFSIELCGGTHVFQTGDIGLFKILEFHQQSAGNKRIVAVTGMASLIKFQELFINLKSLAISYNSPIDKVQDYIKKEEHKLNEIIKERDKIIDELLGKSLDYLSYTKFFIKDIPFIYIEFNSLNIHYLKTIGHKLNNYKSGFYLLVNNAGQKNIVMAVIDNIFVDKLDLNNLVQYLKNHKIPVGVSKGKVDTIIQSGYKNHDYNIKNLIINFYNIKDN